MSLEDLRSVCYGTFAFICFLWKGACYTVYEEQRTIFRSWLSVCKFWGSISNYKKKRVHLSIASEMEVKGTVIVILNTENILMNDFSYSIITTMLNKSIFSSLDIIRRFISTCHLTLILTSWEMNGPFCLWRKQDLLRMDMLQ